MAFNFFGTFTTGQFDQFLLFSKYQEQDIKKRRDFLVQQLTRVGKYITLYDDNNYPISFTISPSNSYGAKLLATYKILGGTPEKDMLLRTSDQPVYLTTGSDFKNDINDPDAGLSKTYSNGRIDRGTTRFDRDLGIRVMRIKNWQLDVIKHKRENIEYKLKRTLDYSDQLQDEIDMLEDMLNPEGNSLSYLIQVASGYAFRAGAQNIVQNMTDLWGLRIGGLADVMYEEDYNKAAAEGLRVPGGSTDQTVSTTAASNRLG